MRAFPDAVVGLDALTQHAVHDHVVSEDELRDEERELIVARIEMGLTYAELAQATGKPSMDAARMAVSRALVRLVEEMDEASARFD